MSVIKSSDYINEQRRSYFLYVLQERAFVYAADGLKTAARRVLWVARDGKERKSAALAGECMSLHPHAAPEDTINTLALHYGNNIPLIKGDGAFGTLLNPKECGASRYTSATISQFTKDVIFRDIEIIPMQDNYDNTQQEPKHFLPLIPITFVNPQEGIAGGFSADILPRDPSVIVKHQIAFLKQEEFKEARPSLIPINQKSTGREQDRFGIWKWKFQGTFERIDSTTVKVTNLPYGLSHVKFDERLMKLEEEEKITEYTDSSKDQYNIEIKFKKGLLNKIDDNEVLNYLGLIRLIPENNMNVIDFDGEKVWETNYVDMIKKFTQWRLQWYVARYERLQKLLEIDIQKYRDIILAIDKNLGSTARKTKSRKELIDYCKEIGIVNLEYIVDLPVYRFTEEEKEKVEQKLKEALIKLKEYQDLLKHESKRKNVYISELTEILDKINKRAYYIT